MTRQIYLLTIIFIISISKIMFSQELEPGDGARLTIYNIPDAISGDFFVQQDWNIQLPFIGLVNTKDSSFESIRAEIIDNYNTIYRNPEITVQPLYRINVLGEVKTPGAYFVTGVEKLSDLLALAGGETQDANLQKISFIRGDKRIDVDAQQIFQEGQRLNDMGLQPGDQVYIPRKRWLSLRSAPVLISLATLIVTSIGVFSK